MVGLNMSITDFSDSLSSLLLNEPYLYIGGSCTACCVKCLGMYPEFSNWFRLLVTLGALTFIGGRGGFVLL